MKIVNKLWMLIGAIFCLAISSQDAATAPLLETKGDQFTAVTVSTIGSNTMPVKGSDNRWHVVYELLLTNCKAVDATLEKITVLDVCDPPRVLAEFEGSALTEALRTLGARPVKDGRLVSGFSKILFVSLTFDSEAAIPKAVQHRIQAQAANSPAAKEAAPIDYTVAQLSLANRVVPVMTAPLKGGRWLAVNGTGQNVGAHRGAMQTVNGVLVNSQRFAIDWMQADKEGRLVKGDQKILENWVGYGKDVLAAGDGVVVQFEDGLPDQIPGTLPDPSSISLANVDGNHVIIDHGKGVFTFYAHLQPGSLTVKTGGLVKAGERLGALGNTGNTSAPHLHFQVMTGPSALGADGMPFKFEGFQLQGEFDLEDLDSALDGGASLLIEAKHKSLLLRTQELPLDLNLIHFVGE